MNPKELVKAGRLTDARHELTELIKAAPADLAVRTLLVQVLLFCGEWAKAEKHLVKYSFIASAGQTAQVSFSPVIGSNMTIGRTRRRWEKPTAWG